jgi:hypothetical protein
MTTDAEPAGHGRKDGRALVTVTRVYARGVVAALGLKLED